MSLLDLLVTLYNFSILILITNSQEYTKLRILKGNIATIGRFPYHVTLQVHGKNICGGAIVSDKHVITAAHCFVDETGFVFNQSVKVIAGEVNLNPVPWYRITVDAERFYVPKDFFRYDKSKYTDGDIAVVKLMVALNMYHQYRYLHRLNLPERSARSYVDETAIITGVGWNWIKVEVDAATNGVTSTVGSSDNILRYAYANIVNQTYCQNQYLQVVSNQFICAKVKASNETDGVCTGDSGGPLVIEGDTLIGVLSYSPVSCDEKIKPALYTRVSSYLNFIEKAIKNISNPNILSIKFPVSKNLSKPNIV